MTAMAAPTIAPSWQVLFRHRGYLVGRRLRVALDRLADGEPDLTTLALDLVPAPSPPD